jgi:hypothetical protein
VAAARTKSAARDRRAMERGTPVSNSEEESIGTRPAARGGPPLLSGQLDRLWWMEGLGEARVTEIAENVSREERPEPTYGTSNISRLASSRGRPMLRQNAPAPKILCVSRGLWLRPSR